MRRLLQTRLFVLLTLAAACGGGGGGSIAPNPPPPPAPPPPPPPPAPVATVTVTPPTASLVVQQTQPLTAATLDASGNTLIGRTVTWTTSAAAVATVSSTGLVTAAGAGSATITATSEGKTGSAAITVADGAVVGATGGNVDAAGGAVKLSIPAGAVTAPVSVTVTANANPPAGLPTGTFGVKGTAYTFGPEGTTFAQPVTVTLKWDPAKTPTWAIPSDYAIYHYTGGAWVKLSNITVDAAARTVSGQTTSFSPFTIGVNLPPATLSPNPASVNFIQRSVNLTAGIAGHSGLGLTYSFATTGDNGAIFQTLPADPTVQYTMTQPSLPLGDLDQVQVIVRGAIDPANPTAIVPLASAIAVVNGNQTLSFEVNPQFGNTGFGQPTNLDAIARNPNGSIYGGKMKYVWTSTAVTGTLDVAGTTPIPSSRGVYTGFNPSQAPHINPRADKITVDFYVEEGIILNAGTWDQHASTTFNKKGTAIAFVEVAPKSYFGTFQVRTTPSPGGSCVAAVVLIPKVTGAASYAIQVTGIVGSALGGSVNKTVTGPTSTGSILDVYDAGANLGVPLEGGCATTSGAITGRQNLYSGAYAHATIISTVP